MLQAVVVVVAINIPESLLTGVRVDAGLRLGAEPGIGACSANVYVLRPCYDHGPRLVAAVKVASLAGIVGIASEFADGLTKRRGWLGGRLIVGRLGLDHGREDVLNIVEVVLVVYVVLRGCAIQPGCRLALDEKPPSAIDGYLGHGVVCIVEEGVIDLMICHPEPHIVKIPRRLLGDVQEHTGGLAP